MSFFSKVFKKENLSSIDLALSCEIRDFLTMREEGLYSGIDLESLMASGYDKNYIASYIKRLNMNDCLEIDEDNGELAITNEKGFIKRFDKSVFAQEKEMYWEIYCQDKKEYEDDLELSNNNESLIVKAKDLTVKDAQKWIDEGVKSGALSFSFENGPKVVFINHEADAELSAKESGYYKYPSYEREGEFMKISELTNEENIVLEVNDPSKKEKYICLHKSDENGYDYTTYDKNRKEIDGGVFDGDVGGIKAAATMVARSVIGSENKVAVNKYLDEWADFASVNETKVFEEGKFMIAGENEIFKGYQNPGYECNGWRAPGFEKEVVEQIVKKLDGKTTYDEKMDQYHYVDKEEGVEEIWVGEDIDTPNGKKHVYFVGEGYMWNEAKDDPELEEEEEMEI